MVDAAAAVTLANDWTNVPLTMRSIESESGALNLALPDAPEMGDPSTVTSALTLDSYVGFIEFVEIEIELEHTWFRDLQIELVSPAGAVSVLSVPVGFLLLSSRAPGAIDGTHRFGSARHLGENAAGTWTLRVSDQLNLDTGTLKSWKLKVYGHGFMPGYVQAEPAVPGPGALTVSWTAPVDTGGPAITSYDLRYILEDDLSAGAWTEVTNVGSTSSLQDTVTGLEGEKKYLVAIRAVNDAGAGPWSDSSSVETESVIPGQPTSLTVAARNLGLAVSWREPGYVGAGPITSYDVRYIREDAADKADPFWTPLTNAWTTGNGDLRYVIPQPRGRRRVRRAGAGQEQQDRGRVDYDREEGHAGGHQQRRRVPGNRDRPAQRGREHSSRREHRRSRCCEGRRGRHPDLLPGQRR